MSELNVGIVGLGKVAGAHINAFKAVNGANVVAVCSRRGHDEAALLKQYGIPLKAYTNYEDMLANKDIHIIDICSQHSFHAMQAIMAAEAGKHIIIEKPICLTYKISKAIRDAINKSGVNVCVCFECRYSDHFTMTRSVIDAGLLGTLHYGEVDYYHEIAPKTGAGEWNVKKESGGSSLLTAGCHALDALLFFMDGKVDEVSSYSVKPAGSKFEAYEYDTTSVTMLKFKGGGKIAKVASSIDCLQPYYFRAHLIGSEGTLLDNRFYSSKLKGLRGDKWSQLETNMVDSGDVNAHPYHPQFQAFINSIEKGVKMPLTDFDTAFETHRVIFAADLSAEEGRPVKLSEFN